MKKTSKKISDHISFKEATHSETAKRLGIKNTPSEDHIKNMKHISETDKLLLPDNTYYIDTNINHDILKKEIIDLLRSNQ